MSSKTTAESNISLSQLLTNGQANASRRPDAAVVLPPPPAANVARKFEGPPELWKLLDLYVDFVLEQNGYAVTPQHREAMFNLILSDRLRAGIGADKFFKARLDALQKASEKNGHGE